MSVIKVEDIAFVRFRAPDLTQMRAFLEDFGLIIAEATERRLVARGRGPAPAIHITEIGDPGFAGIGFRAGSVADLEALARSEGVDVVPFDLPGGGSVVTLTDPNGHRVQVVAGQTLAEALPLPPRMLWNIVPEHARLREPKRVVRGPSHVVRIGHAVLNVADFRASERWYKDRFGFITSDEVTAAPEFAIGAFMRCDRGEMPTDHHTLFLAQHPNGPGFNHAAFEVVDLDDLMCGHNHLAGAGRQAEWGVGRHFLGSQVFDYWRDPWGHTLEHWTDGDMFTAADGSRTATLQEALGVQWGPDMPSTMT